MPRFAGLPTWRKGTLRSPVSQLSVPQMQRLRERRETQLPKTLSPIKSLVSEHQPPKLRGQICLSLSVAGACAASRSGQAWKSLWCLFLKSTQGVSGQVLQCGFSTSVPTAKPGAQQSPSTWKEPWCLEPLAFRLHCGKE